MKRIYIIVSVICVLILSYFLFEPIITYTSGWSDVPETKILQPIVSHQDSISKKADSLMRAIYAKLKTPAISIAIGQESKVVWSNAMGYQDIKKEIPVDLETKFRIGSTSKAVTSLGIGVLIENKKVSFLTKVKEFVPNTNKQLSEVSLKQLASHTSGIRNYRTCFCFPIWEYYSNDEYHSVAESIDVFYNDKLLFDPGSGFSYSTYNYTLLSAILVEASKMSFPNLMKQHVFGPLGLKHISLETSETLKNTAKFYEVDGNAYKEVFKVNNSNKWAGGGFLATPTDLVKIGNAFLNYTLFTKETTVSMTQAVRLKNGEINEQNYAIGWRNDITDNAFNDSRKVQILHHGGTANGSTSLLILFPEYNISVSLLMNRSGFSSDLFIYAYKFAELFAVEKVTLS